MFAHSSNSNENLQASYRGGLQKVITQWDIASFPLDGLPVVEAYGSVRLLSSATPLFVQANSIVSTNSSDWADYRLVNVLPKVISALINQVNGSQQLVTGTVDTSPVRLSFTGSFASGNWYTITTSKIRPGLTTSSNVIGIFRTTTPLSATTLEIIAAKISAKYIPISLELFLLDGISTPSVGAYATFKLRATYTGFCLRVQSGSNTLDVGFNDSGMVDLTAISNWGNWNGTDPLDVVRWYDQSGNGRNLNQSGSAPRLYFNGWVNLNGVPALNFNSGRGLASSISSPNFNLSSALVCFRNHLTNPNFGSFHSLLCSWSGITNDWAGRFGGMCENNNTGAHNNPFPTRVRRNGEERTVALSGTYAPTQSTQMVYIESAKSARSMFVGQTTEGNNGTGRNTQSCAIGFSSFLSTAEIGFSEQLLMSLHGI